MTIRHADGQFATHGHIRVNGRKVDVPSYRLRPGDVVSLRSGSRVDASVCEATELVGMVPARLLADHDELWGRVEREPARDDIDTPIDEKHIVEFYSL